MRGTVAKRLRRQERAYGPRSEWTKDGYFPKHPHVRGYTIMTTYQTMVPKMFDAAQDPDKTTPIAVLPGTDGKAYNYRYVPFLMNGRFEADLERRKYKAFKYWWKAKGIICGRLKH
jgi:hypothetical protein